MWENFIFLIVNAAIPAYMYYSCPTHINLDPSSQKNEIEKCGNSFMLSGEEKNVVLEKVVKNLAEFETETIFDMTAPSILFGQRPQRANVL